MGNLTHWQRVIRVTILMVFYVINQSEYVSGNIKAIGALAEYTHFGQLS